MTHEREHGAAGRDIRDAGLVDSIRLAVRVVGEETQALRSNAPIDLVERRNAKDLCLLDLTRRSRALAGRDPGPEVREDLQALREAIIENQDILRVRIAAARKISDIFVRAIADEESDKTYSDLVVHRGRRR
jgi:hypothetical protein